MKKIALFLSLILLAACLSSAFSQSTLSKVCKPGTKLYVCAPTGLNFRDKPDVKGKVLQRILSREAVEVINFEPTAIFKVDGIPGSWVHVKYKGQEGYLFDGYLSRIKHETGDDSNFLENILRASFKVKSETRAPNNVATEDVIGLDNANIGYLRIDFTNGVIYEDIGGIGDYKTAIFPKGVITFQEMYFLGLASFTTIQTSEIPCPYNEKGMHGVVDDYVEELELVDAGPVFKILYTWISGG